MPDRTIGEVALSKTVRFVFAVAIWQGQARGSIRKFVQTAKYTGPAKSGLFLKGELLAQLHGALKGLARTVPAGDGTLVATVGKNRGSEIRVTMVAPDGGAGLPSVDVREYVETASYTGPTPKGIRFPWDKLAPVVQLMEVLLKELGTETAGEVTLFPDVQPGWVEQTQKPAREAPTEAAIDEFSLGGLKCFPNDFVDACEATAVQLPDCALKVTHHLDGHHVVTTGEGFDHRVRNEVEGKFLVYAHQRGARTLAVPKTMFLVFKAVAAYEKYCRELRQDLVRKLERKSGNRHLAEYQAKQIFQTHGLPML
jgi:hypothetical protein